MRALGLKNTSGVGRAINVVADAYATAIDWGIKTREGFVEVLSPMQVADYHLFCEALHKERTRDASHRMERVALTRKLERKRQRSLRKRVRRA